MADSKSAYTDAGVDIPAGNLFSQMIADRVNAAWPDAKASPDDFSGSLTIPTGAAKASCSVDGTGTKILVAALLGNFKGIGQDAVAMAAVDSYVAGHLPHTILDVIGLEILVPNLHIQIIDSIIAACRLTGCRLLGGETAELPGMYKHPWAVNLDAFCLAFPSPEPVITGIQNIQPKHKIYGWPSHGVASNGFSLVREIFNLKDDPDEARSNLIDTYPALNGRTLAECLLKPTPIWISEIERARKELRVKFAAHAHITGGGLVGNIPRILPPDLKAVIGRDYWQRPPIFPLIQRRGKISTKEMDTVFNQGIMMLSIPTDNIDALANTDAIEIGEVRTRREDEPQVQFTGTFQGE